MLEAPAESEKFKNLYDRYYALVSRPYDYYTGCTYDIGWILTETILEAQSTDALDVIPLQSPTCYNQFGATGWCRLNEAGDRYTTNYQIWYYKMEDDEVKSKAAGFYDYTTGKVTWYTDEIGYIPPTH